LPLQIHKGAAKVGAMVAGLAVALPARATEMLDQVYREDFDVQFMGTSVDHKLIIYAIVLGQVSRSTGVGGEGSCRGRLESVCCGPGCNPSPPGLR
jgi:hypothetical protein